VSITSIALNSIRLAPRELISHGGVDPTALQTWGESLESAAHPVGLIGGLRVSAAK